MAGWFFVVVCSIEGWSSVPLEAESGFLLRCISASSFFLVFPAGILWFTSDGFFLGVSRL